MKLYLAQINSTVGDVRGNVERVRAAYAAGIKKGAELVITPEMALVGYPPKDLVERRELVRALENALACLARESGDVGLLVGTVRPNPTPRGRRLINAAVLLAHGRILETRAKTLLPAYDVFDEERYFEPSPECRIVEFKGAKLAVTICEDLWNFPKAGAPEWYHRDPVAELAWQGPDIIINISASPYDHGKFATRLELISKTARQYQLPTIYVNQVGANDELIFDGRSLALTGSGEIVGTAAAFKEDFVLVDLESPSPVAVPQLSEEEELVEALCLGIHDYLAKCGFKKALVGLSGGIDSSVVVALAARSLGSENVWGVSMPSQFNISASVEDAQKLAANLGIRFDIIPIQKIFEQYLEALHPIFGDLPFDVAEENTQARIRGSLLMALSNKFGHIVLTTGNKSEAAVGYCTLYGDMCGGLAVISDVPKGMVYRIAHWFNSGGEVIPKRVIERPPSAELRPEQKDQDTLPPYDVLDRVLTSFVEEGKSAQELIAGGIEPAVVCDVIRMININEYKRYQAAPVLKVTSKAFGFGRRWPIAKDWSVLMPE